MTTRGILVAGLVALLAPLSALADECRDFNVAYELRCSGELMAKGGSGLIKKIDAWTPRQKLALSSLGKRAKADFGDYSVSARLECSSGRVEQTRSYQLVVEVTSKQKTAPVQRAAVRNLLLQERQDKEPIRVESYLYFEPDAVIDGVEFSRLDYSCSVAVSSL